MAEQAGANVEELNMEFFKLKELKAMLKLSTSQLYALIDSGKLRCHRFTTGKSGGIRVSRAQLEEYLRATESRADEPAPPLKHIILR